VVAGERYWLGDLELLALDAELEALRPAIAACVGLTDDARIDRALTLAAEGGPLALVGPAGTGAAALAAHLHDASLRRRSFLIAVTEPPMPRLDASSGGTVFVDLEKVALTAQAAAALFATPPALRPIFAATTERRLRSRLVQYRDEVGVIELVPLSKRPGDVVPLLAAHWVNVLGTQRRVAELADAESLAQHDWPGNQDELYEQSPRLLAILEHRSLRAAAQALGITRQTLSGHLERLGVAVGRRGDDRAGRR
jgi:transcriptional regulator of aromatic amino acid metabolism